MTVAECDEGSRLLASYRDALTVFQLSLAPIFNEPRKEIQAAQAGLREARRDYWAHVLRHGCASRLC
jgi:hypothetical protein